MSRMVLAAALVSVLALGACSKEVMPPGDAGVCYNVSFKPNGELVYHKLVNAPNLETCAANLEAMRIKFLRMGGTAQEILGAYQSNFIFVQRAGIFSAASLDGPRYLALVRTGDGRLAIPGAMPQPPPQ
ncbi:hypothetical protein LJR225_000409 [Phenylobacterium sp. LjRoot225]|uniref:hypothetical protein n=1 Tax=Phenylobacterium sp. LjRoot225 TaxID=3342285 RepID=UPI003ECD90A2